MIRQVLYSWGKLYFPWGIEDTDCACEVLGRRVEDPLSGSWKCVQVVPGGNAGFDSAIFEYVPAPYPIHPAWRDADPYPVAETESVNAASPEGTVTITAREDSFLRAGFVRKQIETHIKWSRNYEEANVLKHLKEALGL